MRCQLKIVNRVIATFRKGLSRHDSSNLKRILPTRLLNGHEAQSLYNMISTGKPSKFESVRDSLAGSADSIFGMDVDEGI